METKSVFLSIFIPLCISAAALLLYSKTSSFDFAYDDIMRIHYNPLVNAPVEEGWNFNKILISPAPPGNLFRPVSTLSLRFNYLISGADAGSYHVFNILVFCFCVFLVSQVFIWLIPNRIAAYTAAILFAVHPICTESVANIVGRQELLAALFGMASLLCARSSLNSNGKEAQWYILLTALLFVLAVHSKESAYTFAAIIPVMLYSSVSKQTLESKKKILGPSFCLISTAILCLVYRYLVLGSQLLIKSDMSTIFFENPMFHLGFSERIMPGLILLAKYLQLIVFPISLSANYAIQPEIFLEYAYSPLGGLGIAAVLILVYLIMRFRRKPWAALGIWFFLAFAFTLNILTPIGTLMGERLAFLPSIGLIGFFAALLFQISRYFRSFRFAARCLVPLIILFFAAKSFDRIDVWRNHASIYKATVIDAPFSPKAAFNLGIHYLARENNLELAKQEFKRAVELAPNYVKAMQFLIRIAEMQQDEEARELWSEKIRGIDSGED